MSITRINSNVASLVGQYNLNNNSARQSQSIERLSSGLRINSGADDPAGLVIAELLKAQIGGVQTAQQNAQQGVNLVKTAEGALNEVSNLLQQMRNNAVSAASDSTNNSQSRSALQRQVTSALTTINQIATTTKYAGRNLLDGSAGVAAQSLDVSKVSNASLGATAVNGVATVNITTAATRAAVTTATNYATTGTVLANAGSITLNGRAVGAFTTANTVSDVMTAINGMTNQTGVAATFAAGKLVLTQTNYGSNNLVQYGETADLFNGAAAANQAGVDAVATVTWSDATTTTFNQGKGLILQDANGQSITSVAGAAGNAGLNVTKGALSFQIGVNAGDTATMAMNSVKTTDLGISASLSGVDISTVAGANVAIGVIDEAINQISTQRGNMGAFITNQLQSQGRSLAVAQQNLTASESDIRNTDYGAEMSNFTTSQILTQSATSFLSQANSMPQMVMQLIKGG